MDTQAIPDPLISNPVDIEIEPDNRIAAATATDLNPAD